MNKIIFVFLPACIGFGLGLGLVFENLIIGALLGAAIGLSLGSGMHLVKRMDSRQDGAPLSRMESGCKKKARKMDATD